MPFASLIEVFENFLQHGITTLFYKIIENPFKTIFQSTSVSLTTHTATLSGQATFISSSSRWPS
jgi:hypothetical protein